MALFVFYDTVSSVALREKIFSSPDPAWQEQKCQGACKPNDTSEEAFFGKKLVGTNIMAWALGGTKTNTTKWDLYHTESRRTRRRAGVTRESCFSSLPETAAGGFGGSLKPASGALGCLITLDVSHGERYYMAHDQTI